ncbi:MAG: hypothetical protein HOE45_10560, partial [Gammaproteobacteria bacterium]|nr:hypothetical protein [Gammaproteobacteria bacterium]
MSDGLFRKAKTVNQLILLSTSACHLCEQAEALLQQLDITYQKIDIAEQEQWQ